MMTRHSNSYQTPARLFHWIIAAAVLLMIPAGLIMTQEGIARPLQDTLFLFHKNMGVMLIPLILLRLIYRLRHPAPPLPSSLPGWQRSAAAVSHWLLYLLLIVMPISGFVRVRAGGFPIELLDRLGAGPWLAKSEALADAAKGLHYAAALLLIAVLAVHIGAALQHGLIRRDGVWSRIWPPVRPRDQGTAAAGEIAAHAGLACHGMIVRVGAGQECDGPQMAKDSMDDRQVARPAQEAMDLTPELVRRSLRDEPDLGPEPGWTHLEEDEVDQLAARYERECGDDPLWLFAYGSLIWKPDFDAVDHRRATAYGWHRSFCLRMTRWRGSPQQNGLMMALERGGRCDGVIYRLPDEDRHAQLRRLLLREIRFHQNVDMIRWIPVHTRQGRVRALVFWAGPRGDRVESRKPLDQVAPILARACGPVGSCAEYLHNTVLHLREFGINDRNLWRLQSLVADEIRAMGPADAENGGRPG